MRVIYIFLLATAFWMGCLGVSPANLADLRRRLVDHVHVSLSRQFVVHDPPVTGSYAASKGWGQNMVKLDPSLLAVSCERIKKELLSQLRLGSDEWSGKIVILLHHAEAEDETLVVETSRQNGRWLYTVRMPDVMDRRRVLNSVMELLLLEMASRKSDHSVEIPAWLVRGMAREVSLSSSTDLVIDSPRSFESGMNLNRMTRLGNNNQATADLHENFRNVMPLDFDRLSWPGFDLDTDNYRNSAQFFVHQLLQLPDGRNAMRRFISDLPGHLNWQIGFYTAFAADFPGRRELDKWWDLAILKYTSHDIAERWPGSVSLARLDEAVSEDVEVRENPDDMPLRSRIPLQSVISSWEKQRQIEAFHEKSRQLLNLELNCSRDVCPLVQEYRKVLDTYAERRDNLAYIPRVIHRGVTPPRGQLDDLAREAIDELNRLDDIRNNERRTHEPTQNSTVQGQITSLNP